MRAVGLITEYNPFHNGHMRHLRAAKEISENVIAVMSGDFVQRGEPAVCGKQIRAKMALLCGVSVVIELPVLFSAQSAGYFAKGAVKLIESTGVVDALCFGAETPDVTLLSAVADIVSGEGGSFKESLRRGLSNGLSYVQARAAAVCELCPEAAGVISEPNNILAIEYLLALQLLNSKIKPVAIRRNGSYHADGIIDGIASASYVRKLILNGDYNRVSEAVPPVCHSLLTEAVRKNRAPNTLNNYNTLLHYILSTKKFNRILKNAPSENDIFDTERLSLLNRIEKTALENWDISEIVRKVKTRRFTHTSIQRAITNIILGISEIDIKAFEFPRYIRVLGFRRDAEELLGEIVRHASLPVIINLKRAGSVLRNDSAALEMLKKDFFASEIYAHGMGMPASNEMREHVIIV